MVLRIRTPLLAPTGTPPAPKVFVKDAGVWKQAITWVKVSGVWKQAVAYVKASGAWKSV
jgi:hypothetical protein